MRVPFDVGMAHYDPPPPRRIDGLRGLEELRNTNRFRFANRLRAWIDVDEQGTITDFGYDGGGLMGSTTIKLGVAKHTFKAIALPDIQRKPEKGATSARFQQTCGGRTGVPAPRRVPRKPFIQWHAPFVWTTLSLTLHADGRAEGELVGASRFPRHWVYDTNGELTRESGLADFEDWYRRSFARRTPWGDVDSPAVVTAVESALERTLSEEVMHGGHKPAIRTIEPGETLVHEGEWGTQIFLLLNGILRIEHDGEWLAEYGPGALLGERASLEDGERTSSVVSVTKCRFAVAQAEAIDRKELVELSSGHRREDADFHKG